MNPQNKYSQFCYNIVVVYLKNPAKQKKYKHLFLHLISLVVERGLVDGCEYFGGMYHLHLQGEVSHVWGGRCLCRQSSRWKCSGGKKGQVVTEVLKRAAPTWVLIVCVFCALLPSAQSCYFQNRPLL
jgi:hypothetical protein